MFGAYGEASADVHTLIGSAAEAQASQVWREAGARSASEMRAVLIGRMRRRVGLATVQAMARHRLARVPYVGVSHAVVQTRTQCSDAGGKCVGARCAGHLSGPCHVSGGWEQRAWYVVEWYVEGMGQGVGVSVSGHWCVCCVTVPWWPMDNR